MEYTITPFNKDRGTIEISGRTFPVKLSLFHATIMMETGWEVSFDIGDPWIIIQSIRDEETHTMINYDEVDLSAERFFALLELLELLPQSYKAVPQITDFVQGGK